MEAGTSELSRAFARQIAERRIQLPAMPGTAGEVLCLCQEESTDARRLSSVIHQDQTIATNVLRVANSPAYRGQVTCASLQQAVSRLGMQLIIEIAMAVSVKARLFSNSTCATLLEAQWQHSVLAAYFTKEIARMRRRNVEVAFLCGLLHDVGKAVLLDNVDNILGGSRLGISTEELYAAVSEQHVAAGTVLAQEWKLPEQIVEAIAHHHDYARAERFADMAMTVCLADQLAHLTAPVPVGDPVTEEQVRAHDVLVALNLYSDQVDTLIGMRERALAVAEGMQ